MPQTTGGFVVRYKVEVKLNGVVVKTVDNLTALNTTINGLQSGKTYTIVVTAKNAIGSTSAQAITKRTT